jgi:(1->4)-alpha-D-glucan 1-alpha-D-glucosylmutase
MAQADAIERIALDADALASQRRRVPNSTYRLQMHAGFSLRDAIRITPYLHALGISHVYTSSILAAKPGSMHGYDVIDHGRLNPEIGTDAELDEWIAGLRERSMGWILDTVPNHMSVGGPKAEQGDRTPSASRVQSPFSAGNEWWADVLENGPASPYAGYFDIAWDDHPRVQLHGKVLLPILGNPYGAEIEAGRFRIVFAGGVFGINYGELSLPVDPRTYGAILAPILDALREELGSDHSDLTELQSIITAIKHLPPRSDGEHAVEACSECRVIKRRLAELSARNLSFNEEVDKALGEMNGSRGDPLSFVRLEELLEMQAYRPSFWRVASDEINYRRFFDVNDLAALSTEREEVFAAVHRKIFEWLAAGKLDGLRIDHPDGLYDPKQYLDRLQLLDRMAAARQLIESQPGAYGNLAWQSVEQPLHERFASSPAQPLYVVVEKILGAGEVLPGDWATDGTTGYEFINVLNGLFVNTANEPAMSTSHAELTRFTESFDDLVYTSKFHVLQSTLASELHMLGQQLDRIAQAARWSRDFTLNGLRHALREVIASFPVYRSYVSEGVGERDRPVILRAIARARRRNPLLGRALFDFIRDTLLLKDPPSGPASPEYRAAQRRFAGKFQQITAPAMAKGLEDTALYVFSRLISLNEVGGDPAHFGRTPAEAHQFFRDRAEHFSNALSPLSTHDTKRSEDARARIDVLSEMPHAWTAHVARWMELNRPLKIDIGEGEIAPDANEEYFLYQTLIGVWPVEGLTASNRDEFVRRIQDYFDKALHEAKVHTTWINPNSEYDAAIAEFVDRILDPQQASGFLADFESFQRTVSRIGMFNSLAQTLVRIAAPGIPDTYQGTEMWDFSLVDPDNRRPVDYDQRIKALADLDSRANRDRLGLARELVNSMDDGRIKLYLSAQSLRFRRDRAELFHRGDYVPLQAIGPRATHAFSFMRALDGEAAIVVVPRLIAGLGVRGQAPIGSQAWNETAVALPDQFNSLRWRNVFTDESIVAASAGGLPLAELLAHFPVALLSGSS